MKLITKPIALVASAAVVVAAVGFGVATMTAPKSNTNQTAKAQSAATQPKQIDHLSYDGQEGKSALELLKEQAKVETKDSSYGAYVDSINDVKGGTNGKYWTFYVNGSMAQEGADAYKTKAGDKIEWKLQ
jgi:hypothetical protein